MLEFKFVDKLSLDFFLWVFKILKQPILKISILPFFERRLVLSLAIF
jgi:hypothetical protein